MPKVKNLKIALQKNSSGTLYATWKFTAPKGKPLDHFTVTWKYTTGNKKGDKLVWFDGQSSESANTGPATYSPPSNAKRVKCTVKPVAKTHKVTVTAGGKKTEKEESWWTGTSVSSTYVVHSDKTPATPTAPSVSVSQYTLTAEIDVYETHTDKIEFEIVKNDRTKVAAGKASVVKKHAAYSCAVAAGGEYKARCRGENSEGQKGAWSEYSSNAGTIPSAPTRITSLNRTSSASVHLTWTQVPNASGYEVSYTTNQSYFDTSGNVSSTTVLLAEANIDSLTPGETYFFRVRAKNNNGESGWSPISSLILGEKPAPPTTWSSATRAVIKENDTVKLYWVHNSEDGSSQKKAQIRIKVNGIEQPMIEPSLSQETDNEEAHINVYSLDTSSYHDRDKIVWDVQTMGVLEEYSDWSTARTIEVYEPPTVIFGGSDKTGWLWDPFHFKTDSIYSAISVSSGIQEILSSFPYYICAICQPAKQMPTGWYLAITSDESYQTTDYDGKDKQVNAGDEVFSQYFPPVTTKGYEHNFSAVLTASNIDLEDDITYTIHCSVQMDSGLSAETTAQFRVSWSDESCEPDAEIIYDEDSMTTSIRPYCEDEEGFLLENILLSVYRREYDGSLVELAKDIPNLYSKTDALLDSNGRYILDGSATQILTKEITGAGIFITDPHPALNYARYRIVATSITTGSVGYSDLPGYPIEENAAVIQWDEKWFSFDDYGDSEYVLADPVWTGSLLKLPYNLDVSDSRDKDVSLVDYIGRKHPVSYYGTQTGEKQTWNLEIVKDDMETLHALRRLSVYMGDVYVREPSGSGYWASISVSFSQTHCEMTIPVSIEITRVEGGI